MANRYTTLTVRLGLDEANNARVLEKVRSQINSLSGNGFRKFSPFQLDEKQVAELTRQIQKIQSAQRSFNQNAGSSKNVIGGAEFEASLRRVQALIDINRKEFDRAAFALRGMGKDTDSTNHAIRQLETELARTQSRLNTARERYEATGIATKNMATSLDIAFHRMAKFDQIVEQTTRDLTKQADATIKADGRLRSVAGGIQSVGLGLSAALTAPLVLTGKAAVEAASKYESARLKLESVTGSAKEAGRQFKELAELAKLPAVDLAGAVSDAAKLQASGFSFNRSKTLIKNISNLAARGGGDNADTSEVLRQLAQLQGKGKFSQQDFNVILERVPELGKLIRQEFGGATAETLRNTGISVEQFIQKLESFTPEKIGFAKLSFKERFENIRQDIERALVPIGEVIVKNILPAIERLTPLIVALSESFAALSPFAQNVIVALTGIVAAAGPVLLVITPVAKAIAALAGFLGGSLTLPVVAAVAAIVGLGVAFKTNFAGFRDIVEREFSGVKAEFDKTLPVLKQTVAEALTAIRDFWTTHGETIKSVVRNVYNLFVPYIGGVLRGVLQVIRGTLQIINGDWSGAWQTAKDILANAWNVIVSIVKSSQGLFLTALRSILSGIISFNKFLFEKFVSIGRDVVNGLIEGIKNGSGSLAGAVIGLAGKAISWFRGAIESRSPAKKFIAIGKDITAGLRIGIEIGSAEVKKALTDLAKEGIDVAKQIAQFSNPQIFAAKNRNADLQDTLNLQQEIFTLLRENRNLTNVPQTPAITSLPTDPAQLQALKNALDHQKAFNEAIEKAKAPTLDLKNSVDLLNQSYLSLPENVRAANAELAATIDASEKALQSYDRIKSGLQGVIDSANKLSAVQKAAKDLASLPADFDPNKRKELEGLLAQARGVESQQQAEKIAQESAQRYQAIGNKIGSFFTDALNATFQKGIKGFGERLLATIKETFVRIFAEIAKNATLRLLFGGQAASGASISTGASGGGSSSGGLIGTIAKILGFGSKGTSSGATSSNIGTLLGLPELNGSGASGAVANAANNGGFLQNGGLVGLIAKKFPSVGRFLGLGGAFITRSKIGGLPFIANSRSALLKLAPNSPAFTAVGANAGVPGAAAASSGGLLASLGPQALLTGGGFLGSLLGTGPITKLLGAAGGTLAAGAAGAAGLFGSGIASALPALFSNPFTAIAAAGIIGGLLIKRFFFGGNDLKKIKEAVQKFYGVSIDNNTAKQIQAFGKQNFGKNYIKQIDQIVQMDQVRSIVEAYAQSSGQKGNNNLVDTKFLEDPNDPRNIRNVSRGISSPVVSLGGLTSATPTTASQSSASSPSVGIGQTIAATISQQMQPIKDFVQSLGTTTQAQILTVGAAQSPVTIQQANNEANRQNPVQSNGSRRSFN